MMRCFSLLLVLCVAFAFAARPAHAQGASGTPAQGSGATSGSTGQGEPHMMTEDQMHMDDEAARAHFRAGQSLYAAGSFGRAAAEFEEAYHLSNRPALLFNEYIAYRDASDQAHALPVLRRYLHLASDVPNRVILEARLHSLEQQVQQQHAQQQRTEQAQEQARQAEAAQHAEEARHRAEEARRQAEEARRRAEEARRNRVNPLRLVAAIVTGVGVAAAATGVVTGIMANNKTSAIEAHCPGNQCYPGYDLETARNEARTWVTATDILLIGGGAMAVAGFVWWLLTPSGGGGAPPSTSASAACTSHGCSGFLRGTF